MLNVYESLDFLKKNGLPVIPSKLIKNTRELKEKLKTINYPIVMKINSEKHKSDIGGVILNIDSFTKAINSFKKINNPKGVLIQEQVKGIELIIGIKKDPVFKQVMLFGLGGIFTEILKDISFRICPFSKSDAKKMIKELKSFKILKGYRNEGININKLTNLLVNISKISVKKDIKALDINPLIAYKDNFFIVDARLML